MFLVVSSQVRLIRLMKIARRGMEKCLRSTWRNINTPVATTHAFVSFQASPRKKKKFDVGEASPHDNCLAHEKSRRYYEKGWLVFFDFTMGARNIIISFNLRASTTLYIFAASFYPRKCWSHGLLFHEETMSAFSL